MDTPKLPERLIVQYFTKTRLTDEELNRLRERLATQLSESTLVALYVDNGPAKKKPSQHEALVRISRGEADAILLMSNPLVKPLKTTDVLGSHCHLPWTLLSTADLRERALLPLPDSDLGRAGSGKHVGKTSAARRQTVGRPTPPRASEQPTDSP